MTAAAPSRGASGRQYWRAAASSAVVFALLSSAGFAQNLELPQLSGPLAETSGSHAFLSSAHQSVPVDLQAYGYVEEEYLL
mgnify:CR=1 FL=1